MSEKNNKLDSSQEENDILLPKRPVTINEKTAKTILEFQKRWQKQVEDMAKSAAQFLTQIQPFYENMALTTSKLSELISQYKIAYTEGIKNLEEPALYNQEIITVHPWAAELASREGVELLDELATGRFSYMQERFHKGFEAYLVGEYQLAAFTFISMIDGLLKQFYEEHKGLDVSRDAKRPSFAVALKYFKAHYKSIFIGAEDFQKKLEAFFKHRNEIMHGGKLSYFDKNICTAALLFLTVTYACIVSYDQLENDVKP